jgi:phosphoribosylanthranilate isomerase
MPAPVIKAIPHDRLKELGGLRAPLEAALRAGEPAAPLAYFLVDTAAPAAGVAGAPGITGAAGFGGTGKTFDWTLLAEHPLPLPFFLAGGIGPQNLPEALAACSPFAVDLNSKVEIAPARKDLEKVRACLDLVAR